MNANQLLKSSAAASILVMALLFQACRKDQIKPTTTVQVSVPTTDHLNKVLFVNDTLGFIVGGDKYSEGNILTTTDGGNTWQLFKTPADGNKSVYAITTNGQQFYAAGYDGTIYKRGDINDTWHFNRLPTWEWIQDMQFIAPNKAMFVVGDGYTGGKVYRMDSLCQISFIDSFDFLLNNIKFATQDIGYVCGFGAILKTEDGGNSWKLQDAKGDNFKSISCPNPDQVYAVGYNGTIITSSNGGEKWEKLRNGDNPLIKKHRYRFVLFTDINTGYICGDKGIILKTTNAGKNWSEIVSGTTEDLRGLTIHPKGDLWVVGAAGTVIRIRE